MTPQLQATLKRLPDRPGVYLLKNERGDVLYVGKAQSLRSPGALVLAEAGAAACPG